ncbi:MAG TPA: histidine phosphatase family protein [Candidatus Paceibacterota bacterium]
MERLIVVRHGEPSSVQPLSLRGSIAMTKLANHLTKGIVQPVCILSSPETRAIASADILGGILGVETEKDDLLGLCPEPLLQAMLPLVYELITRKAVDAETVIVVSHVPLVNHLPMYYGKMALNALFIEHQLGYGDACIITHQDKSCELVGFRPTQPQAAPQQPA